MSVAFTPWRSRGVAHTVRCNACCENSYTVVNMPPHFYGELVRTSEGFGVLKNSGHFQEFRDIIVSPDSSALEKRGALWVMGQIGKSKKGFKFLETEGVVHLIVDSAMNSPCLPIRRYSLPLVIRGSRCAHSSIFAALVSMYWACCAEPNKASACFKASAGMYVPVTAAAPPIVVVPAANATPVILSLQTLSCSQSPAESHKLISVPQDPSRFFAVSNWDFASSWAEASPASILEKYPENDVRAEILLYATNLSNHITTDKALSNLKRYRNLHYAISE